MPEQETIDLSTVEKARAAWVTALRSGEYRQGREQLKSIRHCGDAYCCLGVAADRCAKAFAPLVRRDGVWIAGTEVGHEKLPKPSAVGVCGLDQCDQHTLMHMNDTSGATFAAIADAIEQAGTGHITDANVKRTP